MLNWSECWLSLDWINSIFSPYDKKHVKIRTLLIWFFSSHDTPKPWKSKKTCYQIRELPRHRIEIPKSSNNFQVSNSNQNTFPQVQMSSTDDWFMQIQLFVLHRITSSSAEHEGPTLITFFLFPMNWRSKQIWVQWVDAFVTSIGTRMNNMDQTMNDVHKLFRSFMCTMDKNK